MTTSTSLSIWYWSALLRTWQIHLSKGLSILVARWTLTLSPLIWDSDIALVPLVSDYRTWPSKQLIDGAEALSMPLPSMVLQVRLGNYRDDLDKRSQLDCPCRRPVPHRFGVSTEDDIKRFNAASDGVIVGSKNRQWPRREGRRSRWIYYIRFTLWKIEDDTLQKWGVFLSKSFFGIFDFLSYQVYNMGGL